MATLPRGWVAVATTMSTGPLGRRTAMPCTSTGPLPIRALVASKKCTPCSMWMPPLRAGSQNQWSGPRSSSEASFSKANCRSGYSSPSPPSR